MIYLELVITDTTNCVEFFGCAAHDTPQCAERAPRLSNNNEVIGCISTSPVCNVERLALKSSDEYSEFL